jgi:hypothetical protein
VSTSFILYSLKKNLLPLELSKNFLSILMSIIFYSKSYNPMQINEVAILLFCIKIEK